MSVPRSPLRLPNIGRVLSADGELQPVLSKARDIRALCGLLDAFFPPELARQARVANFREGEVVLAAANAATAAKLRLLAPSLCRFLANQRWQVNSVSVRVQPTNSRGEIPSERVEKTAQFSTSGLGALRALHDSMKDSPAREALHKLLARQGAIAAKAPAAPAKEPAAAPQKAAPGKSPRGKARP